MTDTRSRIVPFSTPYAPRRIWSNDYGYCVEQAAALAYLKWRGVSACIADDGALCWQTGHVEAVFLSCVGWCYPLDALRV